MALFLVSSMPLFVVGAAVYLAQPHRDPPWADIARAFGAGVVFAFPAYVLVATVLAGFAPSYRGFSLYVRAALGEHLLPVVLAVAGAVAASWWRSRRSHVSSAPTTFPQNESLIASLGGFLTTFAILERLSHLDDASSYYLLLLPLLRLATVGILAGLAALAVSWNGWTRAGIVAAGLAAPLAAGVIPLTDALQVHLVGVVLTGLLLAGAAFSLRWLGARPARLG